MRFYGRMFNITVKNRKSNNHNSLVHPCFLARHAFYSVWWDLTTFRSIISYICRVQTQRVKKKVQTRCICPPPPPSSPITWLMMDWQRERTKDRFIYQEWSELVRTFVFEFPARNLLFNQIFRPYIPISIRNFISLSNFELNYVNDIWFLQNISCMYAMTVICAPCGSSFSGSHHLLAVSKRTWEI